MLSGCYPKQVSYHWGWATHEIQGTMLDQDRGLLPEPYFLVVQEYYSQFVQMEGNAPIYVPRARLVFPQKDGSFHLQFDYRASQIQLAFIAPGYVMQRFFFQRQMGVGALNYQALMQATDQWQDHLLLTVGPFLRQFIVEEHYRLLPVHQLFLEDWLDKQTQTDGARRL